MMVDLKKLANRLIFVGLLGLFLILFIALLNNKLTLDNGQKIGGYLTGIVGVILTLGGVLLYYTALNRNVEVSDKNTFLIHFSNTINNLNNNLSDIVKRRDEYIVIGSNNILEHTNKEIKEKILEYLESTYPNDKESQKNDKQFLQYLNDFYFLTYANVYSQFLPNIEYLLFLINERSNSHSRRQYYKLLRANIPSSAYVPLFYYMTYKINSPTLTDSEKLILKEIITNSNLFEYLFGGDLILQSHKSLL